MRREHLSSTCLLYTSEILEEISVRLMADSQEETIDSNIKLLLVGLTHVDVYKRQPYHMLKFGRC